MFTGLVQDLGTVESVDATADGVRLTLHTSLADEMADGDSVAVNGVCVTATRVDGACFAADAMHETLRRCTLGAVVAGTTVNVELALRAGDRLGGHVVQGHVDGVGEVAALEDDGFARIVTVRAPPDVLRYVVRKGSIAMDGVSLTVSEVTQDSFAVSLVPETLQRTTLGATAPGRPVNLEVDVLAKYVEKLCARGAASPAAG